MPGILIGKARRITLDELRAAANGALLEMHEAGVDAPAPPSNADDLSSALRNLNIDGMSSKTTRASLTLLALTLAQGNCIETALSSKLVDVLNRGGEMRLPLEPEAFAKALKELDSEGVLLEKSGEVKSFVGRVISLARISLSLSMGESSALVLLERSDLQHVQSSYVLVLSTFSQLNAYLDSQNPKSQPSHFQPTQPMPSPLSHTNAFHPPTPCLSRPIPPRHSMNYVLTVAVSRVLPF